MIYLYTLSWFIIGWVFSIALLYEDYRGGFVVRRFHLVWVACLGILGPMMFLVLVGILLSRVNWNKPIFSRDEKDSSWY